MSEVELGKLTRIQDIRTIWSRERQDFSRWLLDNGDYLAEVLGIELELDHQEKPVGDFSPRSDRSRPDAWCCPHG